MDPLISPFFSVLGTNYVPTDEEVVGIRRFLNETASKGIALGNQIAKVALELQALQAQQAVHDRVVSQHMALLSPIKRIPAEILALIFLRCLPTTHNALMSATQAPIVLTHVCRGWRTLALGRQDLWSSIYIPIPPFPDLSWVLQAGLRFGTSDGVYPQPLALALSQSDWSALTGEPRRLAESTLDMWRTRMRQRKDLVVEWLQRAGSAKLSITIMQWSRFRPRIANMPDSSEEPVVKEIMGLVKVRARQWRILELSAVSEIVDEILSLPTTETPNIEAVKITSGPKDSSPWREPTEATFLSNGFVVGSPTLRSLHIQHLYGANFQSTGVQWENLTKFVFCGHPPFDHRPASPSIMFTPSQTMCLLEKCPNLVECGISIGSTNPVVGGHAVVEELDTANKPLRHLLMRRLEILWVHEQEGFPLNTFFASLDIPLLRSLKFITDRVPHPKPSSPINSSTFTSQATYPVSHLPPETPWVPPSLPILLGACGSTIRVLEFDYSFQSNESLQECLSLVPDVEDLRLSIVEPEPINFNLSGPAWSRGLGSLNRVGPRRAYMDDGLFRRLFLPDGTLERSLCLCPRMNSFQIQLVAVGLTEETLLEFVKSRRSERARELGLSTLKNLKVKFVAESEPARERRRREFTKRGVDLVTGTEWIALQELEELPGINLERFKAEVTWPMDPELADLLSPEVEKVSVTGPWSAAWALEETSQAKVMREIKRYFSV